MNSETTAVTQHINALVNEDLPKLDLNLREWVAKHLVQPRKIEVLVSVNGHETVQVWLVTDDVGHHDSAYRIVFNEPRNQFGLVAVLANHAQWYMDSYGSFAETVESM